MNKFCQFCDAQKVVRCMQKQIQILEKRMKARMKAASDFAFVLSFENNRKCLKDANC